MSHCENLHVLVVDDHFLPRQMVVEVLRMNNVTKIESASNGAEAIDAMNYASKCNTPFNVIFLDWNMPDIMGLEVLQKFRDHPDYMRAAFVMLTAETSKPQVLEAIKSGITSYIAKPVSKNTINQKFLEVVHWLDKQKT